MDYRLADILSRYGGEKDGENLRIPCPVHHGKDNNCAVWIDDKDTIAAHCHSHGCAVTKLLQDEHDPRVKRGPISKDDRKRATWLKSSQAPTFEPPRTFRDKQYTRQWMYTDSDGIPTNFIVVRYDGHDDKVTIPFIFARLPDGREEWIARAPTSPQWYNPRAIREDIVVIVEGEKAASHGQKHCPEYGWMSWSGGASNYNKMDLSILDGKRVILWPDNDEPGHKWAFKGDNNLYDKLNNPAVVIWDGGKGSDVADIEEAEQIRELLRSAGNVEEMRLKAIYDECAIASDVHMNEEMSKSMPCGFAEKCAHCRFKYIPGIAHPADLISADPHMKDYAYIETEEIYVDMRSMHTLTASSFNMRLAAEPGYGLTASVTAVRQFGEDPGSLKVRAREFRPGQPLLIDNKLNMGLTVPWTRTDVPPTRWIRVAQHVFGDRPDELEHVLDWLAYTIQQPDKKINHTLLVKGKPGVGKSLFFAPIQRALRRVAQERVVKSEDIDSNFSGFLENCKLLVMEELNLAAGGHSVANKLKTIQASPPEYIMVNPKYGRQFEIPNVVNIIAYSNNDLPIKLEENQRRWYVIETDAPPIEEMEWYSESYGTAMVETEIDSILTYLHDRSIAHFNPYQRPAMSEAAQQMILDSVTGYRDLAPSIKDIEWPDLVSLKEVKATLERDVGHSRFISDTILRKLLPKLGWTYIGDRLVTSGSTRFRPWATRRGEMYLELTPSQLSNIYAESHRKHRIFTGDYGDGVIE